MRLFKKLPFFKAYQHFIEIQVLSKDASPPTNIEYKEKWTGFVESKLRKFLGTLEKFNELKGGCMEFRPWPKTYTIEDANYPNSEAHYIGIRMKKNNSSEK